MEKKKPTETTETKTEPVIPTEIIKYKHKNKDKVGILVHNGVTKTLRFDDGSEIILSPGNFKRYWELLSVEPKEEPTNVEEGVNEKEVVEEPKKEDIPVETKQEKKKTPVEPVRRRKKEVDPNHLSWSLFRGEMIKHNELGDGSEIFGVIVYSQSNFNVEYSELSRSYRISSKCNVFNHRRGVYGDCLDGSESGVELPYAWKIDYCYFEKEEKDNG